MKTAIGVEVSECATEWLQGSLAQVEALLNDPACPAYYVAELTSDRWLYFQELTRRGASLRFVPDDSPDCDCPNAPAAHLSTCWHVRTA